MYSLRMKTVGVLGTVAALACAVACAFGVARGANAAPQEYLHVGYQPYKLGDHDTGTNQGWGSYSYNDVLNDMRLIRQHFTGIRTWTIQYANGYVIQAAHAAGVKVAMGAWGFPNSTSPAYFDAVKSKAEIDAVVAQAKQYQGTVTAIICGNENLADSPNPNGLTKEVIEGLMTYTRQKLNASGLSAVRVGTCQTDGVWIGHGSLAQYKDCDIVFANIYPFWHGDNPTDTSYFQNMYSQVTGIAGGKPVVVGETGWATKGSNTWWGGTCKPSEANAGIYFTTISNWFATNKKEGYLFEMFDEPWKYSAAMNQESHFGIVEGWNNNHFKYAIPTIPAADALEVTIGELRAEAACTIAVALREEIAQAFDYYLIAETPLGTYTVNADGSVDAGIRPLYRGVPGIGSHVNAAIATDVVLPQSLAGRTITFYTAMVEAGVTPPVPALSDLTDATPGILQFDKETGTVR